MLSRSAAFACTIAPECDICVISGSEYVDYDDYVYYGLAKGGILFPLLLLVILLVAFIALLVATDWRLYTYARVVCGLCFLRAVHFVVLQFLSVCNRPLYLALSVGFFFKKYFCATSLSLSCIVPCL